MQLDDRLRRKILNMPAQHNDSCDRIIALLRQKTLEFKLRYKELLPPTKSKWSWGYWWPQQDQIEVCQSAHALLVAQADVKPWVDLKSELKQRWHEVRSTVIAARRHKIKRDIIFLTHKHARLLKKELYRLSTYGLRWESLQIGYSGCQDDLHLDQGTTEDDMIFELMALHQQNLRQAKQNYRCAQDRSIFPDRPSSEWLAANERHRQRKLKSYSDRPSWFLNQAFPPDADYMEFD